MSIPITQSQLQGIFSHYVSLTNGFRTVLKAVLPIPFGIISDNYGRKILLFIGCVSLLIGSLLESFYLSFTTLLVSRTLIDLTRTAETAINSITSDLQLSLEESSKAAKRRGSLAALLFIVATSVSAYLFSLSPLYPSLLALALSLASICLLVCTPESLMQSPISRKGNFNWH